MKKGEESTKKILSENGLGISWMKEVRRAGRRKMRRKKNFNTTSRLRWYDETLDDFIRKRVFRT